MLDITKNLNHLHQEIARLAQQSKRKPDEIRLIAVSKTQTIDAIAHAYRAGQRDFAENYVQEAEEKIAQAKSFGADIQWHYIGQIQSNKCTRIAENFNWVHSLASLKHAQRLNNAHIKSSPALNVCVQVSLEEKTGRNGVAISELKPLLTAIDEMHGLQLRGLMCVLPLGLRGEQATTGFTQVKNIFDGLKKEFPLMDTLSMGMSADYAQAIRAGSTMLRLGTALFGQRSSIPNTHSANTETLT